MTTPFAFPLAISMRGEEAFAEVPRLAEHGIGIEISAFLLPQTWQGDAMALARRWRDALREFAYPKAIHGAFVGLQPTSDEPEAVALARTRHRQSLEVAAEIGCDLMVVHSDMHPWVRPEWVDAAIARHVEYFGALAAEAAPLGVTVVIEDILDRTPGPLLAVVRDVGAANLALSLDVGHAALSSSLSAAEWVTAMAPSLRHVHLDDNDGQYDHHWPMGDGIISFAPFFDAIRAMAQPPRITVEVRTLPDAWETVNRLTAMEAKLTGVRG